jgi:hypothetical protein
VRAAIPPVKNTYGPVADAIYITATLTAPAVLRIQSGGRITELHVQAGSHDVSAPFSVGSAPTFTLTRSGAVVLKASGTDDITASPSFNNFYYSTGEAVSSAARRIHATGGRVK